MARRKGKQSSGRNTPVEPAVSTSNSEHANLSEEQNKISATAIGDGAKIEEKEKIDADPNTQLKPDEKTVETADAEVTDANDDDKKNQGDDSPKLNPPTDLILTSEKRRGIYECDYCHSDISQLPRIRCAVCQDFDLCLDCFVTTDHASAIARLKAAAMAHSELKADGIASTLVVPATAADHDDTHGYRVCDSTRYPISGSARQVVELTTPSASSSSSSSSISSSKNREYRMIMNDDPKSIWTAEEDLRLLDAIQTHGLGNWTEISDAISGNGSTGKTPKRCMERYLDDFFGRYGHILPEYTIVEEKNPNDDEILTASAQNGESSTEKDTEEMDDEGFSTRSNGKRGRTLSRATSTVSNASTGGRAQKRFKVIPTESLPKYEEWWPEPYLPPIDNVVIGQEVARDLSRKHELDFVKLTSIASSKKEVDRIRKEWEEKFWSTPTIGAPTVLPPRPEDSASLPGADLVGFMPRRGDFDIEYENEAEVAIAEMEFLETDTEQEKDLKIKVLQIYHQKQNEREKRKQFILSRKLYDYRQYVKEEQEMPQDERDLRHRMRLFERFHTPEEHKIFIDDIIKAKRLRKEIAKLQMYRRIGIRSLAEAEKYELDKSRRQFHKIAQLQKEAEAKQAAATAIVAQTTGSSDAPATSVPRISTTTSVGSDPVTESSLWKNYRPSDRKARRSLNRLNRNVTTTKNETLLEECKHTDKKDDINSTEIENHDEKEGEAMLIDNEQSSKDFGDDRKTQDAKDGSNSKGMSEFDISTARGFDLLSSREGDLCVDLEIYPAQYLEIKKALIQESLTKGLLDKEGPASHRRMVLKLDISRRGKIVDFMLQAGWISPQLANKARTVTPPPTMS